ncbi:hypothetical protein [Nocardia sp. NPDC057455]|uniref:hypothetical protein n=1 Tax=Nocardia sp. NPDC057455 TaxID=3346138 RepID=UPI00366B5067
MSIDPHDPEYREYALIWNAIANALIDDAAANGRERPCLVTRDRIANRAWRNLHPDSPYGATK